jgi:acetyltransferase
VGYSGDLYAQLADIVLADVGVDLLIAVSIDHKNRRFPSGELIELSRKHGKPVVVYYISDVEHAHKHREACQAGGIPFYLSAEETAWGAAGLVRYARLRS